MGGTFYISGGSYNVPLRLTLDPCILPIKVQQSCSVQETEMIRAWRRHANISCQGAGDFAIGLLGQYLLDCESHSSGLAAHTD